MKCSNCNKIGEFPKLICNCTICRDCFYDFCCPKCRRDFADLCFYTFQIEVCKVDEGLIFDKRGFIYFTSLSDNNIKIYGEKYDEFNTLIKKSILRDLNFRYLCVKDFRNNQLADIIIDLNDFRIFKIDGNFSIHYIGEIKVYEPDFPEAPRLRRQMNFP